MDLSVLANPIVLLVVAALAIVLLVVVVHALRKGYSIELWPPKFSAPTLPTVRDPQPPSPNNVLLVGRHEVDAHVDPIEARLRRARHEIRILGNDNKFVAESCSPLLDEALKRGVRVKVLFTDPSSPTADMLARVDPRFHSADEFQNSIASVFRLLEARKRQFPSLLEFRVLPVLPALGLFITDPDDPQGLVKAEIYTMKPFDTRPHIILPQGSPWRSYLLAQWNNYWAAGQTPPVLDVTPNTGPQPDGTAAAAPHG